MHIVRALLETHNIKADNITKLWQGIKALYK